MEVLPRPSTRLHHLTPGVRNLVRVKKQDKEAATDTPHMQLAAVSLGGPATPFIAQSFTVSQTIHFSFCCLTSYRILTSR